MPLHLTKAPRAAQTPAHALASYTAGVCGAARAAAHSPTRTAMAASRTASCLSQPPLLLALHVVSRL